MVGKYSYFVFYDILPEGLTKEEIEGQVNAIHNDAPNKVVLEKNGDGFQVEVTSTAHQNALLGRALCKSGQEIKGSKKSGQVCKKNTEPCPKQHSCFYRHTYHLALLCYPLYKTKAFEWATKYWQSKVQNLEVPPFSQVQRHASGILVPSEFYNQIVKIRLFTPNQPIADVPLSFKINITKIRKDKETAQFDPESYFIYVWKDNEQRTAHIYILSYILSQIEPIQKLVRKLLDNYRNGNNSNKSAPKNTSQPQSGSVNEPKIYPKTKSNATTNPNKKSNTQNSNSPRNFTQNSRNNKNKNKNKNQQASIPSQTPQTNLYAASTGDLSANFSSPFGYYQPPPGQHVYHQQPGQPPFYPPSYPPQPN